MPSARPRRSRHRRGAAAALEERLEAAPAAAPAVPEITLGGVVEVEAVFESAKPRTGSRENASDLVLATAQLNAGARLDEHLSATLVLLYEEGDDAEIEVDEATLDYARGGFRARVGRQYLPFSAFPSALVSDPLTQELGETRETALRLDGTLGPATVSAFVFRGDAGFEGRGHVDDWGVAATFAPSERFAVGAGYLCDLADTGAELAAPYTRRVAGWSAYATAAAGVFGFSVEAVGSARRFAAADLDADGDGAGDRPLAWNAEISASPAERWTTAARAGGSREIAGAPGLQWGAAAAYEAAEGVTVALEYLHGEYGEEFGEDLDTSDGVTLHVGVEW